jgi:hypothetical protein
VQDQVSRPYSTTPEILGIGVSNMQMFVCFITLILQVDIETVIFLYRFCWVIIEILFLTVQEECLKTPHKGRYILYLDPSKSETTTSINLMQCGIIINLHLAIILVSFLIL